MKESHEYYLTLVAFTMIGASGLGHVIIALLSFNSTKLEVFLNHLGLGAMLLALGLGGLITHYRAQGDSL